MSADADLMFEYLRNLLYSPTKAVLNIDQLSEDNRTLGQGLLYFGKCLSETRVLVAALARGDFDVPMPSPDNELASPLKSLYSSLKHLTWQTQQVAKGDYGQHVDFMGDFSVAFNQMTRQLEQRQKALEQEIDAVRHQTQALQKSNSFLEAITDELEQRILVVDAKNRDVLFRNRVANQSLTENPQLDSALLEHILTPENLDCATPMRKQFDLPGEDGHSLYFSVSAHPLQWRQLKSVAFIIRDITADVSSRHQLEAYAFKDPLTGLYNRHYGIRALENLLAENRAFSLCFIDLDNLKFVNDSFGHSEGDNYIILAAGQIGSVACSGAVACRIGGDEFMLLLPGMDEKDAEALMWASCASLMEAARSERRRYQCSISFGVAEHIPGSTVSPAKLLELADERMYAHKKKHKSGRGIIIRYDDEDTGA